MEWLSWIGTEGRCFTMWSLEERAVSRASEAQALRLAMPSPARETLGDWPSPVVSLWTLTFRSQCQTGSSSELPLWRVCPAHLCNIQRSSQHLVRAQYTVAEMNIYNRWNETRSQEWAREVYRAWHQSMTQSMAPVPSPHRWLTDSRILKMEGYLEIILFSFLGKTRGPDSYGYIKVLPTILTNIYWAYL